MTSYNNKVYCGKRSPNTYCKVLVWDLDTNDGLVDLLSFDARKGDPQKGLEECMLLTVRQLGHAKATVVKL